MPGIEGWLASIQDAVAYLTDQAARGWPDETDMAKVQDQLSNIDSALWALVDDSTGD